MKARGQQHSRIRWNQIKSLNADVWSAVMTQGKVLDVHLPPELLQLHFSTEIHHVSVTTRAAIITLVIPQRLAALSSVREIEGNSPWPTLLAWLLRRQTSASANTLRLRSASFFPPGGRVGIPGQADKDAEAATMHELHSASETF